MGIVQVVLKLKKLSGSVHLPKLCEGLNYVSPVGIIKKFQSGCVKCY